MIPRSALIVLAVMLPVFSQASMLTLSLSDFSDGRYPAVLEKSWKYHAGDSIAWASPDYDDSGWSLHASTYRQEDLAGGRQAPLCWYRMSLQGDSALARKRALRL